MFGTHKLKFSVCALLFSLCGSFSYSEINHVSQSEIQSIQSEFALAQPVSVKKLRSSSWDCSMIGVQTALQKLERIQLYNFKEATNSRLQNHGFHKIEVYQIQDGELRGTDSDKTLTEDLRINGKNELIGRLSRTGPNGSDSELAYSKCKQL